MTIIMNCATHIKASPSGHRQVQILLEYCVYDSRVRTSVIIIKGYHSRRMIPILGIIITAYDCRPMILALGIRGHASRPRIPDIIIKWYDNGRMISSIIIPCVHMIVGQ